MATRTANVRGEGWPVYRVAQGMSAQRPRKNGDGRFVQTVMAPGSNHAQPAARISEGCTAARSRADLEPKHELRKTTPHSCPFVSIRGSKNTPHAAPSGQISGWKARPAFIRAHSCSFVVQKTPLAKPLHDKSPAGKPDLHSFVPIRVHSWFKTAGGQPPHISQLFSVDRTAVAACFRAGRLGFRAGGQSLKHPLLGRSTRPRTRPVKSPRNRF